ncbi:MAG: vitamin K epoxide reductase family protein [Patescibacteria group bacterium]|nr:vitamin K epoxide reductase family protein [Patescibacteria group bacterium]
MKWVSIVSRINKFNKPIFLATNLIGIIDASYLTTKYYSGEAPACTVSGCEKVLTSPYATIGNVPVSLLGLIYYITIFVVFLIFCQTKKQRFTDLLIAFTTAGLLFSAWLVYLQLFIIQAICLYCLLSATTATFLFLLAKRIEKIEK